MGKIKEGDWVTLKSGRSMPMKVLVARAGIIKVRPGLKKHFFFKESEVRKI
jgi:hypothetical protein